MIGNSRTGGFKLMTEAEEVLLLSAKHGDQNAFADLVRRYQTMVYNLAYSLLGEAEAAADAAQEAFFRAWRGLPSFAGDSSFATWLYVIAHRTSLTIATRRRATIPLAEVPEPHAGEASDPFAATVRNQEAEMLRRALMRLPARARTALVLYHYHDRSYEEIARITGEPLGTVRTRLHRGRARLKEILLAKEGERECAVK